MSRDFLPDKGTEERLNLNQLWNTVDYLQNQ